MGTVTQEQLEALAKEVPRTDRQGQSGEDSPEVRELHKRLLSWGLEIKSEARYQDGWKFILTVCPFDASHNRGEAVVIRCGSGAVYFTCHHESCKGKKWADVLKKFEADAPGGKRNAASSQESLPSTPEEVSGESPDHEIAQDLFDVMKEYIVIPDNELTVLAVFVLHTHSFKTGSFASYLNVCSPEKGSGKTRVLLVQKPLVRNSLYTENISPAALARIVELEDGTMLVDEIDTVLGPKANKEVRETMRGIMNSGYHKSGTYVRMVGVGTNMQPHKFSTFCPKVFAGLGLDSLPDTTASRSIPIHIRRARRSECKRFRPDGNGKPAKQLRERLEKLRVRAAHWAKRHAQEIADAEPDYPANFTDRQCDISEPLLAIASVLGDPWPAGMTTALTTIFNSLAAEDNSKGVLLLGHIRKVFLDKDTTRLHTEDLIAALCAIPEAPWPEWNKGKNLNDRSLAKLLKGYGIRSTTVRAPLPGKGYKVGDFYDACERYLKPVCMCPGCRCHESCDGTCNASENADSANDDAGCNGVTDKTERGQERKDETGPQTVN
jgi:hypothetical protein